MAWNRKLTPEGQILVGVRHFLRWKGWFVIRVQQGPLCYKGMPDLIASKGDKTLWVEIKTPTGRLSEHQKKFKADMERVGSTYLVIRSIDEMEEYLKEKCIG